MLESAVITITKAFDVLYTTSSAIFFPFFKQIIACKILPPSNGYIGTRFKIASNTFVFTIILLAFIVGIILLAIFIPMFSIYSDIL